MEETPPLSISDSRAADERLRGKIAHHTLLSILGQGAPLLLGLAAIPIVYSRLGDARFGILGLTWAGLSLAGAFDMGLGRATVRFVAESLERGDTHQLRQAVTWALLLQFALGVGAGAALAGLTPILVSDILRVPAELLREASAAFYILAASLPFVLLSFGLRAVLEGAERFDIANLIRIPASSALFVLPAVGALAGLGLGGIMVLLLVARIGTCVVSEVAMRKFVPSFRWTRPRDSRLLKRLATYGGWVAVSNVLNPLLFYFDRFLLGALVGMAAVAYYTAAFEVVIRLSIVPGGLAAALFPAITVLSIRGDSTQGQRLLAQGARYLTLILAIPAVVIVGFAGDLLSAWMGSDFAREATLALQILTCGVFVNALAHLPHGYLQATGRPDVTAKFHLFEVPVYVIAAFFFVDRFGVTGAALAWTFRVTLDAALLFSGIWWLDGVSPRKLLACVGWRTILVSAALGFAVAASVVVLKSPPLSIAAAGAACVGFAFLAWRWILDASERELMVSAVSPRRYR